MVEVARLLQVNSHHAHPHAFEDCLGDRYLYAQNPVYKKIRDCALLFGLSYCREGSPLWHDYQVCPLFCLNTMLEAKSVPLIDNKSSLIRLLQKAGPSFAVTGKFLTKVLKRNYLLHESSHYVAHCVIASAGLLQDPIFASEGESSVAAALLAEAFATTTERIAWSLADNQTHILLFTLNSYVDYKEANYQLIVECLQKLGHGIVSRLGMIALFLNNLRKRPVTDGEFDAIVQHFFPQLRESKELDQIRQLVSQVFSVTPAFLEETTPTYFRMFGLEDAFVAMSNRDYSMKEVEALMLGPIASQLQEIIDSACCRSAMKMAS